MTTEIAPQEIDHERALRAAMPRHLRNRFVGVHGSPRIETPTQERVMRGRPKVPVVTIDTRPLRPKGPWNKKLECGHIVRDKCICDCYRDA